MPETWQDLARDSRKAASELVRADRFRAGASRAYYAAYSIVTHEFNRLGLPMPRGREGPSHNKLRSLILANMNRLQRKDREALASIVGRLYTLRVQSDYCPSAVVDARDAHEAISLMNRVFEAF